LILMATDAHWESYRTAAIDLDPPWSPGLCLTPDVSGVTGSWPQRLSAPIFIITAWNPDSVLLDATENRARHGELVDDLDRLSLVHWPAVGRDATGTQSGASHHEEGVAIEGLGEAEATSLGRGHGQAAIYAWTPEAWEVLSCTDARRITLGWQLKIRPSPG
jgi:hypothetical protein